MKFPWLLSMCIGFLSLSQEILWMRYVSFSAQSVPSAFSFVLTIFLIGIAAGALAGRVLCARTGRLYTASGITLLAAGALDMAGPLIASLPVLRFLIVPFIFLCAALKGIVFPVAHHLGSSQTEGQIGKSVSRVYFMNITGSAMGPLMTGFWLVDHVSLQTSMLLMGFLTALLGVLCMAKENKFPLVAKASFVPVLLAALFLQDNYMVEKLACHPKNDRTSINRIIETKTGIIHSLVSEKGGGDYTFGGNAYDGRDNIDPRVNSNLLQRVFVLAALKPEPEKILVIGLSSGAWARILTGFPGVKQIEVVEINPGYLQLIEDYPEISPFLKAPRVHINIDDARRWLKRHPAERFDMIVMNTTFHWRSYSTNLLSQEFLRLLQNHLNPGGLLSYNTTNSPDALKTAESVFPFAFRYINFAIAGDHDFRPRQKTGRARLLNIKMNGKKIFDPGNPQDVKFVNDTLSIPFKTSADERALAGREPEIITDWNMITEFKYGQPMPEPCDNK